MNGTMISEQGNKPAGTRSSNGTKWLPPAVMTMALLFIAGCAVSDYRGYLNHRTSGEAKLYALEFAVDTGDPETDGTYSFTVKYDFRGTTDVPTGAYRRPINIVTYRNRVVGAFNGDVVTDFRTVAGKIERDGDDIRCNAGNLSAPHDPADPAGIWERRFVYRDRLPGIQGQANFRRAFVSDCKGDDDDGGAVPEPAMLLSFDAPQEEVDDKNLSLQCRGKVSNDPNPATPACGRTSASDSNLSVSSQVSSANDSLGTSLSVLKGFVLGAELKSIELNGNTIILQRPFSATVTPSSLRAGRPVLDLTTERGQELIKAILANTKDGEPVTVAGTLTTEEKEVRLEAPASVRLIFNHAALQKLIKTK